MSWKDTIRKEDKEEYSTMPKNLVFEWMTNREHGDDWNEWIKEKQDAVQEQQTEEIPVQEEAESGEEAVEAQKEE